MAFDSIYVPIRFHLPHYPHIPLECLVRIETSALIPGAGRTDERYPSGRLGGAARAGGVAALYSPGAARPSDRYLAAAVSGMVVGRDGLERTNTRLAAAGVVRDRRRR